MSDSTNKRYFVSVFCAAGHCPISGDHLEAEKETVEVWAVNAHKAETGVMLTASIRPQGRLLEVWKVQAADPAGMVSAVFAIEEDQAFRGFHNPAVNWNGFACPYFKRAEAEKVAAWLNTQSLSSGVSAVWVGDVLEITDRNYGEEVEAFGPDSSGLYSIGAFAWCWSVEAG